MVVISSAAESKPSRTTQLGELYQMTLIWMEECPPLAGVQGVEFKVKKSVT